MDARKPDREPRQYRIPLRTRQQQAKVVRACKDLKTFITIDFPFKGAPRDCDGLNKCVRDVTDALSLIGVIGVCFIEFNNPDKCHGRNVPHLHVAATSEFEQQNELVRRDSEAYQELVMALNDTLPWFASSYLSNSEVLDVKAITDLEGLAGYLAKLRFELEGAMRFSLKGEKQKIIPKRYFPLRRTMRFFGGYKNPLKNQTNKKSIFHRDDRGD